MKILFLADNFIPEVCAPAVRVYERARHWAKWGHEVTIITSAPNFPEGKLHEGYSNAWRSVSYIDGIRVVRVKTFITANSGFFLRIIDFLSYFFSAVFFGLFEKKPDLVVSTSPQLFTAVAGFTLSRFKGRPFVFELGDIWPASIIGVGAMKPGLAIRLLEKLELFLYRKSVEVIALTPAFKKNLISRGIPAEKISVVINGVEVENFHPQPRDNALIEKLGLQGKFIIGYIGTHGMAQGLQNMVETAKIMHQKNWHFLLIGSGAERDGLMALAQQYQLSNITFLPSQPRDTIKNFWSICDVALIHLKDNPVFAEVIPSKVFEIMAMGLPVLYCGPKGEVQRIIEEEKVGICCQSDHPEKLAHTINRYFDDPALRKACADKSAITAEKYSRETQAKQFMERLICLAPSRHSKPSDLTI